MEKIITSRTGGRLANQLYFVLQAYIQSKNLGIPVKYHTNRNCSALAYDISKAAQLLNISEFVDTNYSTSTECLPMNVYFQRFGIDFSEKQLNDFISTTIAKVVNKQPDNSIAVHIRNGDYLSMKGTQCFDRKVYLKNCFSLLSSEITEIHIFSDDNRLNKQLYDALFHEYFKEVIYEDNDLLTDFKKLSGYRHKILWNSTYSFWTAFVSNIIFKDNFNDIYCPTMFVEGETSKSRTNPRWTFL